MADEARIQISLQIDKDPLFYQSRPTSYTGDVDGTKGPTPGALTVSTTGTDVSFAQLSHPGYCWLQNLDDTNFVEWGIHDGTLFHPVGQILPGECYVIRLSPSLGREETLPGTGSTNPPNTFYLRADTASCDVVVAAFEA